MVNTTGTAVNHYDRRVHHQLHHRRGHHLFEDFKNNLVSFGYEDVIAAYQAAFYDRYLAR